MDLLFEKDKPHFASWVGVYNIDEYGYSPIGDTPEVCYPVPLYYAALCGFSDVVERLLTAHPQDPDAAAGFYGAPLNAALAKGYLDITRFLLDRGAIGDNMGNHDQTGLYIASSRGYTHEARSLIDQGADISAKCRDFHGHEEQEVWRTPLLAAICEEHPDIALLLLEGGADPETRSSKDQTPLCMASSRGYADVVQSLIDRGADLNAKSEDWTEDGDAETWTPLHAVINKDRRDIVLLLLKGGADAEAQSGWGESVLHLASSRGRASIARQLISHGADPNAEGKSLGDAPLMRRNALEDRRSQ